MRPVTKGTPAIYAPSHETLQSTQFLWDSLILRLAMENNIAAVKNTLSRGGVEYRVPNPRPTPDDGVDLDAEIVTLKSGLDNALSLDSSPSDMTDDDKLGALRIGQTLIAWYEARLAPTEQLVPQHERIVQREYSRSRRDLITNIGQYCSYCEMPLAASLAVEHMLPKQWFPHLAADWDNFLLACPMCNSIKHDRPTLSEGAEASPHQEPDRDQAAEGARSLLLWPSNAANYPSFNRAFQYQLYRVLYNLGGDVIEAAPFTTAELNAVVQENRIRKHDQEGGQIRVRVQAPLFKIEPAASTPVIQFLRGITKQTEITSQNVGGVPQVLVDAFRTFTNDALPDVYKFRLNLGTARNVFIQPEGANVWSLTQTEAYYIEFSSTITLYDDKAQKVMKNWKTGVKPMLLAMAARNLPGPMANFLGVDQFSVSVEFIRIQRGQYGMRVVKKYLLHDDNGTLKVFADQIFSVELRIAAAQPTSRATAKATAMLRADRARVPQAAKTIDYTGLNRNLVTDIKQSDRRVARRTNAFFAALDALSNFNTMTKEHGGLNLSDAGSYANLGAQMVEMIARTAAATGFWSVWHTAFTQFMSANDPARADILAALNNKFTGTR